MHRSHTIGRPGIAVGRSGRRSPPLYEPKLYRPAGLRQRRGRHATMNKTPEVVLAGMKPVDPVSAGRTAVLACVAAGIGVLVWSYLPVLQDLVAFWGSNPDYSAGYFVPLIAAWMAWSDRRALAALPRHTCWWGVPALLGAQAVGMLGMLYMYGSLERYSIVLTVAAMCLLLFGPAVTWRLKWVLLFLFLMMPLPGRVHNAISLPLQTFATQSAVFGLECLGYLVSREGNVLRLTDQNTLAIAEACSGLRMLTAFIVVAATLAAIVRRPRWQKVVLVLSSIPIAILANTLRLITTAVVYEGVGGENARRLVHDFAGIAMMPLAWVVLLIELRFLRYLAGGAPPRAAVRAASGSAPPRPAATPWKLQPGVAVSAAILLVCCGMSRDFVGHRIEAALGQVLALRQPLASLPLTLGDWDGRDVPMDEDVRRMAGDDESVNREYVDRPSGRGVGVYIGYMGRPRARMGHRPDVCYGAHGFKESGRQPIELTLADGAQVPAVLHEFRSPDQPHVREIVVATFLINGRYSGDPADANSYNTRDAGIFMKREAYVARAQFSTRATGDDAADVRRLKSLAGGMLPLLSATMPVLEP